jgi:uncharacterized membrane protein YccC
MPYRKERKWLHVDRQDFIHAARTAIAAVASLLVARLFRLPEAYWAAIATMIAMQSTLGAAWTVSRDRFVGTVLGAVAGALLLTYTGSNIAVFGAGVFILGPICSALRVEQPAYRYAGITLIIVMMTAHTQTPWMVAAHRFAEISIGLAVGLILTAIWPERQPSAA